MAARHPSPSPHPGLPGAPAYSDGPLRATLIRTAYGVPHVIAADFESLGFGNGHAVAEDHALLLCEHVATVRGERARMLGAGLTPGGREHLDSDIGHRILGYADQATQALSAMSAPARALLAGFVTGFNTFLREHASHLPAAWRASPALRPLCDEDIAAVLLAFSGEASGRLWVQALAWATPPGADVAPPPTLSPRASFEPQAATPGSNAWAIGDGAAHGARSILGANPHFPTGGGLRFHEIHLTIPGHFDVAGVALLGCPTVNLGFNNHIAWTHTVSAAERFVVYRSPLERGHPTLTRRESGAGVEALSSRVLEIPVLEADGTTRLHRHTAYATRHGPVLHVPEQAPWTAECAYSIFDANARNFDVLDHWLALGAATSLDDIQASFARWQGTGWVNLLATDALGEALYIDGSTVPALTPEATQAQAHTPELREWRRRFGVTVLPGDDERFDPQPRKAGMSLPDRPWRRTRGVLANFNDSFHLVDAGTTLSGYSALYGSGANPLSLRARRGHAATRSIAHPSAAEIQALMFDTRVELASLLLDEILARLDDEAPPRVDIDGECVDIQAAIAVLRAWSRHDDLDAVGAPLFRELADLLPEQDRYATPFDSQRPLETPCGLGISAERGGLALAEILGRAVQRLQAAGVGPDATLRQLQYVWQANGRRRAVAGGPNLTGVLDVQQVGTQEPVDRLRQLARGGRPSVSGLAPEGYRVGFGTCWAAVIEFIDGRPRARSVLGYSQASNPDSPWHEDQASLLETRRTKPFWFDPTEVRDHAIDTRTLTSSRTS